MEFASNVNEGDASHPALEPAAGAGVAAGVAAGVDEGAGGPTKSRLLGTQAGAGGPTKSAAPSFANAKGVAENENASARASVASIFFRTIVGVFRKLLPTV